MNICFISPYSPRTVNGIGTFLMGLAKYLKKRGHDTRLITKYEEPKIYVEDIFNSNNTIEIKHTKIKYLANIHFTLLTLVAIYKARHSVDILHLQQTHMISAFSAVFAKVLGIPVVTTVHVKVPVMGFKRTFATFFNIVVFTFSDDMIYVSKQTKKSFGHSGKIIRNSTDTAKFKANCSLRTKTRVDLSIRNNLTLLFLGRVAFNKGIYELLDAIKKIRTNTHNNIKLLVVGPIAPEEESKYTNYIEKNGLENHVLNFGAQEDVQKYYCSSDIFILPSHIEGLPLSLLEAMSCGLPCIVSRVGGVPEVITHEENGLLIEPKNLDDLIQKITWCLDHQDESKIIGLNAAKTVNDRFNMKRMSDEYTNVYKKLIRE